MKKLEALSCTQKAKVSMTSADAWAVIVFGCGRMSGGDSWQALKEIREAFGLNTPDKANSWKLIRQQEQARRQQIEAEKDAKRQWIKDVDALKAEAELLSGILSSAHCEPLSWLWCVCQNRLTTVNIQLDLLCGV